MVGDKSQTLCRGSTSGREIFKPVYILQAGVFYDDLLDPIFSITSPILELSTGSRDEATIKIYSSLLTWTEGNSSQQAQAPGSAHLGVERSEARKRWSPEQNHFPKLPSSAALPNLCVRSMCGVTGNGRNHHAEPCLYSVSCSGTSFCTVVSPQRITLPLSSRINETRFAE